jgi:AcrR family transcriptional regulator
LGTKGEETRDRILRAARDLFYYQGYRHTTIDDISRASGVRRGNLYFYFASKEDLARAAIDHALRREFPFLEKAIGEEKDPLKRVEMMIDVMVGYVIDHGCKGG